MIDFPPEELSSSDPLGFLCRADGAGLLIAPGESVDAFAARLDRMKKELPGALPADLPEVSSAVRTEAGRITDDLYGFVPGWLPAFYSSKETGHFSAGVLMIVDDLLPLVCLADAFQSRSRHRGYTAEETLAHEMVHAARSAFPESAYEEYFPCQVHASRFRRLAGNLFRKWYIPLLFFLGLNPFLFFLPLLILLREMELLRRIRRASDTLNSLGLKPGPVLVRLSDDEIRTLAAGKIPDSLADENSLRRQLFFRRFGTQTENRPA